MNKLYKYNKNKYLELKYIDFTKCYNKKKYICVMVRPNFYEPKYTRINPMVKMMMIECYSIL